LFEVDDWIVWIVAVSEYATEGLLDAQISKIWNLFVKGFNIHGIKRRITDDERKEARLSWYQMAVLIEKVLLCDKTHFVFFFFLSFSFSSYHLSLFHSTCL